MIVGLRRALGFARTWKSGATRIQEAEVDIPRGDRSVPATLLHPEGARRPLSAWVVLHGVTRPGRYHPMLVRFIRALAGGGVAALVPEIPEWRELNLAPDEAAATIRASVLHLSERKGILPDRIGIIGFSMGVPQALHAAADPALEGRLRGVAGFGGYGNLDRTLHFLFQGEHEWEGETFVTEPDPYGRWIIGGNYLTRAKGFEDAGDVAQALLHLARKAGDLQIGAWTSSYDSMKEELQKEIHPSRRHLFRTFAPPSGQLPSREFSDPLVRALAEAAREANPYAEPASFLDRIPLPVRLVHGREDRLIPFSETLRLAEAFPHRANIRVYLTGLFSHSQANATAGIGGRGREQLYFLRILSSILSLV